MYGHHRSLTIRPVSVIFESNGKNVFGCPLVLAERTRQYPSSEDMSLLFPSIRPLQRFPVPNTYLLSSDFRLLRTVNERGVSDATG